MHQIDWKKYFESYTATRIDINVIPSELIPDERGLVRRAISTNALETFVKLLAEKSRDKAIEEKIRKDMRSRFRLVDDETIFRCDPHFYGKWLKPESK